MDPSNGIHRPAHPWPLPRCCPDAAPLCRCIDPVLSSVRGAASNAQCQLGCVAVECGRCWWRYLLARQVILSSCLATQCIAVSDWALPWRPVLAVALLCPSVAPVALAGSPADSPTGLQLQMCLGAAHWLRHQLTASSDPRSRCLQIMPTRRPPTNSQCCSNLVRSALCSALLPSTANRHQQATKQSCWQSSAVYSAIQSSAAQLQTLLGTQKSVPARRPAGLQQTVSSFNPGRCPSPLPFSNSPSPP